MCRCAWRHFWRPGQGNWHEIDRCKCTLWDERLEAYLTLSRLNFFAYNLARVLPWLPQTKSQQPLTLSQWTTHRWKGLFIAQQIAKKATKKYLKYHGHMTQRWQSRVSGIWRWKPTALRLWSSYEARSFLNRSAASSCTLSKTLWVAMATDGTQIQRCGCGDLNRLRATSRFRIYSAHYVVSEPISKL